MKAETVLNAIEEWLAEHTDGEIDLCTITDFKGRSFRAWLTYAGEEYSGEEESTILGALVSALTEAVIQEA